MFKVYKYPAIKRFRCLASFCCLRLFTKMKEGSCNVLFFVLPRSLQYRVPQYFMVEVLDCGQLLASSVCSNAHMQPGGATKRKSIDQTSKKSKNIGNETDVHLSTHYWKHGEHRPIDSNTSYTFHSPTRRKKKWIGRTPFLREQKKNSLSRLC